MDGRREKSHKQLFDQSQSRASDESPVRAFIAADDKVVLCFVVLHAFHTITKGAVLLLPLRK